MKAQHAMTGAFVVAVVGAALLVRSVRRKQQPREFVFLLGGQSNMAGRGCLRSTPQLVWQFDEGAAAALGVCGDARPWKDKIMRLNAAEQW
jgi:hypothetical protein